jgi:UDP-N-acetylmuramoyl-tripeptide--D-alanyl-D-alanine ligase
MFTIESQKLIEVVGGKVAAPGTAVRLSGVSTDTRTLGAVSSAPIFVAIKGPHFDAHTMLADAARAGAKAMIVEQDLPIPVGCWGIRVASTVDALGKLAQWWRRDHAKVPVVAVTGSNGKSTTKQMIVGAVDSLGPVLATEGNFNNLIGLPLTVFRWGSEHRVAVLEMGMNAANEIRQLTQIAEPDVGLITNVTAAHLDQLKTVEQVARAKGELFETMRPNGAVVVNVEDPWVRKLGEGYPGRKITFGMQDNADIRFGHMTANGLESLDLTLFVMGQKMEMHLKVPGFHNVMNAMAALGVAVALNVPAQTAIAGIESFTPMKWRMERLQLASGVQVINDCYNANPLSMAAALHTVSAAKRAGRFVAVLGSMRELGSDAAAKHVDVGSDAAKNHVDLLFTFGEHANDLAAGARQAGLGADRVVATSDMEDLQKNVTAVLKAGDVVLIKGSRGMKMERLVEHLKNEMGVD